MALTYKSVCEELQWMTLQQLDDLRKQELSRNEYHQAIAQMRAAMNKGEVFIGVDPAKPGSARTSVELLTPDGKAALEALNKRREADRIWDMVVLAARSSRYD